MPIQENVINYTIKMHLENLRTRVAEEKIQRDKREALLEGADQWTSVPDDIGDEVLEAIILTMNINAVAGTLFTKEFLDDFANGYLPELQKSDLARYQGVIEKVVKAMEKPPLEPGFPLIETLMLKPKNEGDDWVLLAVPVEINENYEVNLPESLACDISMVMEVSPRQDESLTHAFSVPALFLAEGTPAKPLAVSYAPKDDGPRKIMVSGRTSSEGRSIDVFAFARDFYVGEKPPEQEQGWDPNAMLDLS